MQHAQARVCYALVRLTPNSLARVVAWRFPTIANRQERLRDRPHTNSRAVIRSAFLSLELGG